MTKILSADQKGLRKSFQKFTETVEPHITDKNLLKQNTPYCLLFFYAIECGLKYCWLIQEKKYFSPPKKNDDGSTHFFYNHEFGDILKSLRVPAHVINSYKDINIRLTNRNQDRIPFSQLHEAWRYGIVIDSSDERKAILCLENINRYIKNFGER